MLDQHLRHEVHEIPDAPEPAEPPRPAEAAGGNGEHEFSAGPAVGLPAPVLMRLMSAADVGESRWKRWSYLGVAVVLACGFLYAITSFWAPANSHNNPNGYLVGARNLATRGTTGFEPASPFHFVGWMWVMADETSTAPGGGMHYPKYPLGMPLIDAIVFRLALALNNGDDGVAVRWVYLVNPVAMSLAVLGTFFLARLLAGSFAGLLGMILLGTLPLVLILANAPNSHALSLCFIVWGMYWLLRWWNSGSMWLGLLAGLLLGYAVTIRYTEGLLLLPMAVAGLTMVRYRATGDVQWWRAGVWMLAATIAVVLNDARGAVYFDWMRSLTNWADTTLPPWQLGLLVGLPVLITARWGALRGLFSREAVWKGEWLRIVGCIGIVAFASAAPLPELDSDTPGLLHALLLAAVVGGACGGIALLYAVRWQEPRTWLPSASLAVGWLIPVVALLLFNKLTFGSWTGYDSTNESTGFTWNEFARKWSFAVNQLYETGVFFIGPIGVTGLAMAFRWNWRAALALTLWFVPGTLLYMAYYYGMNMPLIGYLRFFTSLLPPVVVAAVWLVHRASFEGSPAPSPAAGRWRLRGSVAAPIAAGIFVACAAAMNVNTMAAPLERDFTIATNLADVTTRIRESAPAGSVIFGHSQRLMNHLQFAGREYELYGADYFTSGSPIPVFGNTRGDGPSPIQPARRTFLRNAYRGLGRSGLAREQNRIMNEAFASRKRVFVAMEAREWSGFRRQFVSMKEYDQKVVQKWTEPATMPSDAVRTLSALGPDAGGRGSRQTWYLVEITPRSSPATKPSDPAQPAPPQPDAPPRPVTQPKLPRTVPATQPSTQPIPSVQQMIDRIRGN